MKFFEIKKSFGFRKRNHHRYRNWSLVSVPDTETWFRSYTSLYPLINYPDLPENHFYLDMPPIHFTMQSSWFYICKFDLPNPPLEIVETRNLHGQTQYLRLLFTFFEREMVFNDLSIASNKPIVAGRRNGGVKRC